jgi:hypothetical protein
MSLLCKLYKDLKSVLRSKEITLKEKNYCYLTCLFKELLINCEDRTTHGQDLCNFMQDYINNS